MNLFDKKVNECFPGLVVRKDLVKKVKGNAIVPSYVLEYLLAQYCTTSEESVIESGIQSVKEILRKHYVHRNEANMIRSEIARIGRLKVIDKVAVDFIPETSIHEATFSNLGISQVLVDEDTIRKNKKLLVGGVWSISDIQYIPSDEQDASPWALNSLKPIQLSQLDMEHFLETRKQFTTDEWIDLLLQSIGLNPEIFGKRSKLIQLTRLIPFCERNYNLIELGPKGTGKSHVYSEFSPHGMLISGGEITVAKLFVNNSSGKIGLVGYWDVVAFDEFAGKQKKVDKALVDILKNYMANKTFSRGVESLGAEASMVYIGNTKHTLPYMLKNTNLFDELPDKFYDSAFLDRLHFYIPGWEVDIIRGEMFSSGYGFVVDYLAEVLKTLRNYDYSNVYNQYFTLSSEISTRDKEGIHKTFSGLIKLIFPNGEATKEEIEEILKFSMEGRKRVKDQIIRIDSTFSSVQFSYTDKQGKETKVTTLEEEEYPKYYYKTDLSIQEALSDVDEKFSQSAETETIQEENDLKEQHLTFQENQKGVTFDYLFGAYLRGSKKIQITDPYIRHFFQLRNLMEFLEVVAKYKVLEEEVEIHLLTIEDEFKSAQQIEQLEKIKESSFMVGIVFSWEFDKTNSIHARHINLDNGWKILLDRGLDIFQHYEMNDSFSFSNRLQQFRTCKAFEVTYVKVKA